MAPSRSLRARRRSSGVPGLDHLAVGHFPLRYWKSLSGGDSLVKLTVRIHIKRIDVKPTFSAPIASIGYGGFVKASSG